MGFGGYTSKIIESGRNRASKNPAILRISVWWGMGKNRIKAGSTTQRNKKNFDGKIGAVHLDDFASPFMRKKEEKGLKRWTSKD